MGRRIWLFVVAVAIAAGTAVPAVATNSVEYDFIRRVNQERSSRGLRSLTIKSDLQSVARRHAARMAAQGAIWHNPRLGSEVSGWTEVGENVGRGRNVEVIHEAFMDSASHRDNILYGPYNQIGVGTAYGDDGRVYVSEVFAVRRSVSTATVTRAPAPRVHRERAAVERAPRLAPARRYVRAVAPVVPAVEERPLTVSVLLRLSEWSDQPAGQLLVEPAALAA